MSTQWRTTKFLRWRLKSNFTEASIHDAESLTSIIMLKCLTSHQCGTQCRSLDTFAIGGIPFLYTDDDAPTLDDKNHWDGTDFKTHYPISFNFHTYDAASMHIGQKYRQSRPKIRETHPRHPIHHTIFCHNTWWWSTEFHFCTLAMQHPNMTLEELSRWRKSTTSIQSATYETMYSLNTEF